VILACIKCGAVPDPVFQGEEELNQPYAATTFDSTGHYGSTVWDPMNTPWGGSRQFIQINVCDPCLTEAAGEGKVLRGITTTSYDTRTEPWAPEEEEVDVATK
jgi:hypothetical protein